MLNYIYNQNGTKTKKSFSEKLKSLLNSKEFKDLLNAYEEDNEEA